jgi:hypothetical protein
MEIYRLEAVLLLLAEFGLLLTLGVVLMRLIYWNSLLTDNRKKWLVKCRYVAGRLRILRRQLAIADGSWARLPMSPRFRKQLNLICWVGKAIRFAGVARS